MNSSFFIFRSLTMKSSISLRNKKASRPHDFREGVLALNSSVHFPSEERVMFLRFGLHIASEAISMVGEAHERTNITRGKSVNTCILTQDLIEPPVNSIDYVARLKRDRPKQKRQAFACRLRRGPRFYLWKCEITESAAPGWNSSPEGLLVSPPRSA